MNSYTEKVMDAHIVRLTSELKAQLVLIERLKDDLASSQERAQELQSQLDELRADYEYLGTPF